MNDCLSTKKYSWREGVILLGALVFLGISEGSRAQDPIQQGPGSKIPIPDDYTFQMLLKPNVDLFIQVKNLPKKGQADAVHPLPPTIKAIRRDIRLNLVRVSENSGDGKQDSVRYYVGGWCAFDDPRKGLNVCRQNIEGSIFPMDFYHFPELIWATPKTRQPDPVVKEGEPAIQLYKVGNRTLVVDVISKRPLRFTDSENEWAYSYKEDPAPIVLPEKLEIAMRRVLSRQ